MPELPEVQTVVSTLRPMLVGRTIQSARLLRAEIVSPPACDLPRRLAGRRVKQIARRGKRIIMTLDDGNRWYVHLGMTGRLLMVESGAPLQKHTHLVLRLANENRELRFVDPRRFGGVWWMGTDPCDQGLGPEPLSITPTALARSLGRTRRAIKTVLLDQQVLAGVGNIYADEALFLARLHPTCPACSLEAAEVKRLTQSIRRVLNKAIRHRGSTLRDYVDAAGGPGAFQAMHQVYDRTGLPCRHCETPIQRILLSGRSTHFCPRCQMES